MSQSEYQPLLDALEQVREAAGEIYSAYLRGIEIIEVSPGVIQRPMRHATLQLGGGVEKALASVIPPSLSFELVERRLHELDQSCRELLERAVRERRKPKQEPQPRTGRRPVVIFPPGSEHIFRLINHVKAIVESTSEPEPESHIYGLIVDRQRRLVRREGYDGKEVDLSRSAIGWHIFNVALSAAPGKATLADLREGYDDVGKWSARGNAVSELNEKLKELEIEVADRTLIAFEKS